jgi:Flp pilus assembly pilin Flp
VRMVQHLWRDQGGASLIEYSILVAVITAIVLVGVSVAGAWVLGMWERLLPILG